MTALGASPPAQAMDRDLHSVIVASEYGLLAGTVIGAASIAFTQDVRSLFVGSSVGLYLGIAVGIYYVLDRDNPNNPLRYQQNSSSELEPPSSSNLVASRPAFDFKVKVISF